MKSLKDQKELRARGDIEGLTRLRRRTGRLTTYTDAHLEYRTRSMLVYGGGQLTIVNCVASEWRDAFARRAIDYDHVVHMLAGRVEHLDITVPTVRRLMSHRDSIFAGVEYASSDAEISDETDATPEDVEEQIAA